MTPLIAACSQTVEPEVVLTTDYIKQNIPLQERPQRVDFPPVDWYVVSETNLDEFLERVKTDTGNIVFFAITAKGYENLAIGIGELRRYVNEQQAIIGYYEKALTDEPTKPEEENPS